MGVEASAGDFPLRLSLPSTILWAMKPLGVRGIGRGKIGWMVGVSALTAGATLHAEQEQPPAQPSTEAGAVTSPEPPTPESSPRQAVAPTSAPPVSAVSGSKGAKRAEALAMTVSGAVSLGSHEAGQLSMITQALRKSPGSTPLRVATGASAGSANALISGSEACLQGEFTAEQSLGYRVWVEVGLEELFDPARSTRQSIFHADSLKRAYGYLEDVWAKGLPQACDFAFGVAVTRKTPTEIRLAEGLSISRSAERFVVRIQGRSSGPPRFFNYFDEKTNHRRPLVPFTGVYENDVSALAPVVVASAAFPVAFPPQPIEYCFSGESEGEGVNMCTEPTNVDFFVDGGVFDNNPLGLALHTVLGGLSRTASGVTLRDVPDGEAPESLDIVYGFVDPDLRTYPVYTPDNDEVTEEDPVVSLVSRLGGQMLASARGHELSSLADGNFRLLQDLWLIHANYPPTSELLGAFFGFFERDFRDFDFHLGTYDSFVDLRDQSAERLGVGEFIRKLEGALRGDLKGVPKEYRKLACIASQVGTREYRHLAAACQGEEMRNFRVLLQLAIDRLWSNCRFLSEEQVAHTKHLGCKQAQGGLSPPQVDPSFVVKGHRYQIRQESDLDYALRVLADYGFHFRDMGLSKGESGRARLEVRRKLILMVEALSAAQGSFLNRTAVMTAGRSLINTIYYEPPRKRAYVGVGSTIFGGYLGRLGDNRAFYWNPDLRMVNIRELLSDGNLRLGFQATIGVELAVLPLSGSVWQTSFGLRGGYQFAANDAIGIQPCLESDVGGDSRLCSGPVLHSPFNFTLLERVRFAFTPVFYPLSRDFGHQMFEFEVGVGAELF